jgi:lipoate-protein ligase A
MQPSRPGSAAAARQRGWHVSRRRGPGSTLVVLPAGASAGKRKVRAIHICEVTRPGFVLGSTQPAEHVDAARALGAGIEICRRRGGGGGVLVLPGSQIWVDVYLPSDDPLWMPDVGHAFSWLGEACVAAIDGVTGGPAAAHQGLLKPSPWSPMLCFAGLGPGEVSADGRKVLGISQRRDRDGATFRVMLLLRHVAAESTDLLALTDAQRAEATGFLDGFAGALEAPQDALERGLLEAISAAR